MDLIVAQGFPASITWMQAAAGASKRRPRARAGSDRAGELHPSSIPGVDSRRAADYTAPLSGAIAQLGERNTGSVEVGGSIPPGSTKHVKGAKIRPAAVAAGRFFVRTLLRSPSSRGLGHRPFTAATGVRIPVGTPYTQRLRDEAVRGSRPSEIRRQFVQRGTLLPRFAQREGYPAISSTDHAETRLNVHTVAGVSSRRLSHASVRRAISSNEASAAARGTRTASSRNHRPMQCAAAQTPASILLSGRCSTPGCSRPPPTGSRSGPRRSCGVLHLAWAHRQRIDACA